MLVELAQAQQSGAPFSAVPSRLVHSHGAEASVASLAVRLSRLDVEDTLLAAIPSLSGKLQLVGDATTPLRLATWIAADVNDDTFDETFPRNATTAPLYAAIGGHVPLRAVALMFVRSYGNGAPRYCPLIDTAIAQPQSLGGPAAGRTFSAAALDAKTVKETCERSPDPDAVTVLCSQHFSRPPDCCRLFHGTTESSAESMLTNGIDRGFFESASDFGAAFYTTPDARYAVTVACTCAIATTNHSPVLLVFDVPDDVMRRGAWALTPEEWVEVVPACRRAATSRLVPSLKQKLATSVLMTGPISGNAGRIDLGQTPRPSRLLQHAFRDTTPGSSTVPGFVTMFQAPSVNVLRISGSLEELQHLARLQMF